MKKQNVVVALAALAQDNHLDVYRLIAPNTLTFHFDRLREAGLLTVRRDGRSMIYTARFDTMTALLGYLTENCCRGKPTSAYLLIARLPYRR